MKFILIFLSSFLALNAHAAMQDLLVGGSPLPTASKSAEMRSDYNVNMGQIIHAFDDGNSQAKDTVLRRNWAPDSSIAVRLRKNIGTLISIPQGERIQGFVLGDQEGFIPKLLGEKMPNKIVISPTAFEIDTNLTLIDENNRLYTFYLRSEEKDSDMVPHFSVIISLADDNPDTNLAASNLLAKPVTSNDIKPKIATENPLKNKLSLGKLTEREYDFLQTLTASGKVNSNYSIYGDKAIAPNAVWDDGNVVYISFRDGTPSSRLPTLYRVVDGYASIANSHYRDGFLITDNISEEGWMLLDGNKTVCIKAQAAKKAAKNTATILTKHNALKTQKISNLSLSEEAALLLDKKMAEHIHLPNARGIDNAP